ncbi:MAG: VRR-NUC domain-containing protein [Gammaproteobacteria bacterium]
MKARKYQDLALEADVLPAQLEYLALDRRVAWAHRMNVGAAKFEDRFVRFGFEGLADIIGQLRDGRFLAVESKRPKGGRRRVAQKAFIAVVNANNGVAGFCPSLDALIELLQKAHTNPLHRIAGEIR